MLRKSCNLYPVLFLFLFFFFSIALAAETKYTGQSVLHKGKWIKIGIEETGLYRISLKELDKLGFDTDQVSIFGYGGNVLSEDFTSSFYDDLPQISSYYTSEYIYFYAKGIRKWTYLENPKKKGNMRFVHEDNSYATQGYYFISDEHGRQEMETLPYDTRRAEVSIAERSIIEYDDYFVHKKELVSPNKSGRKLFGESLSSPLNITFDAIENLSGGCKIEFGVIAKSPKTDIKASFAIDNTEVYDGYIRANNNSHTAATELSAATDWEGGSKPFKTTISLSGNIYSNAYLDYILFNFKRSLRVGNGSYFLFRNVRSQGQSCRFEIAGTNIHSLVWDVTDPINPKIVETKKEGDKTEFRIPNQDMIREFALLQPDRKCPEIDISKAQNVESQNLHGLSQYDMIVITPVTFIDPARELADYHIENDGLKVCVVTSEQIYNEFSSGTPDATAYRRFMKMFYDRQKSEADAPKYLLLFGDGSYDNRFITEEWKNKKKSNYLLTYQTRESLTEDSHVSDDYFGFLSDSSGKDIKSDKVDIGIGRIPVTSERAAKEVVTKIKSYSGMKGNWKHKVAFMGDDGNSSDDYTETHQQKANELADLIETNRPEYQVSKILFDSFKRINGKYEEARVRLHNELENGLFLLNYVGHGDTRSLSEEQVLTQNDITSALNYSYLPIWITACCDFCRYDAVVSSAGEDAFLKPEGGAIALFTTSRVAYEPSNHKFNESIINSLFAKDRVSNLRLGDVIKQAKRDYYRNDWKQFGICLIGDPALRISYPDHQIEITQKNNEEIQREDSFFLKAKENVTFEGNIKRPDGSRDHTFNGTVIFTLFDNKNVRKTLGNHGEDKIIPFDDYNSILFDRIPTKVINGDFTITFDMPRVIQYTNSTNAKISLYAYNEEGTKEAGGGYTNLKVYGTEQNVEEDKDPPKILSLYLNDTTFTNGDKVNSTPLFVAKVWDKSGINIGGYDIGHDIILRIDNHPGRTYVLNNYYQTSLDDRQEGLVQFSIPELPAGKHTAEFYIWDIMTNGHKEEFEFEVVEGLKPNLYQITANPNPAREYVDFKLYHNRPKSRIQATVYVYNLSGGLIWKDEKVGSSELFKDFFVRWDLTDMQGVRVKPGIYLYRAGIVSGGSKEATRAEKIIVLRP